MVILCQWVKFEFSFYPTVVKVLVKTIPSVDYMKQNAEA